jgi:hypothetical protein
MFLTQKKEFIKVYIPGYTGHVPNKKNLPPSPFIVQGDHVRRMSVGRKPANVEGRHPGACSNLGK